MLTSQQKLAVAVTVAIPATGLALADLSCEVAFRVFAGGCLCLAFALCPVFLRDFFGSREAAVAIGWIGYIAIAAQVFVLPHLLEWMQ